jgi:hypothetical protein
MPRRRISRLVVSSNQAAFASLLILVLLVIGA